MRLLRGIVAAGVVLAVAGNALARKEIADVEVADGSGTHIELSSVFDPPPPTGYAPIRVVATNGANQDSQWSLHFDCSTQQYRSMHRHSGDFSFTVAPKARQTRMLLVPVSVRYGHQSYGDSSMTMQIKLRVSGLGARDFFQYENRVSNFPAIAISKALADNAISRLETEVETRMKAASRGYGDNVFGSRFDVEDLPEDWRGLSGFDFLMISHTEWQSLKSASRLAVAQWARLGGRLHVYMGPGATAASLDLPQDVLAGSKPMSLGTAEMIAWDGKYLPTTETVDRYWHGKEREKELTDAYTQDPGNVASPNYSGWALLRALGERSFASWQVLLFLVIFGILVGPVNLFVLAPSSRRHRLFITTPLLSLGASGVMITILLLQDGIGGIGRRFVAIDIQPGDTSGYVTQEQVSRSGLLIGTAFDVKHAPLLQPLALPDKPWVKLNDTESSQATQLHEEAGHFSGNFFQSRTEQGQILRAAVPTRARLELKAGPANAGNPQLISALGFTAQELFYVDAEGAVWKSTSPAATGQVVATEKSDAAALKEWWKKACKNAGPRTRERLELQIERPRGMFFAKATQAQDFVLDTLKSIRWSEDQVVIFGAMPKS